MNRSVGRVLILNALVLAPTLLADHSTAPPPRMPRGIYVVVNVDEYAAEESKTPSCPSTNLDSFFSCLYGQLLGNPAVSGITLYETWARLNPNDPSSSSASNAPPIQKGARPMDASGSGGSTGVSTGSSPSTYDWGLIDNLFLQVEDWNSANPDSPPKTVQLVITPGFNSPPWLLSKLYSCDFLFDHALKAPPKGEICGKATFNGFIEGGSKTEGGVTTNINMELPMPWNPTYKSAWQTFLEALAARYQSYAEFVTIAVAGPTASSEEIMVPVSKLMGAGATQIGNLTPEQMWSLLLAYFYPGETSLQTTDQAFVNEWKNAIEMYGNIFGGVTLDIATGSGLPDFSPAPASCPSADSDCTSICPHLDSDCIAESQILSYFAELSAGGPNAKAVQTDGMKASGGSLTSVDLAVPGVKWLSTNTQLLGGAQFAKSFSLTPDDEGSSTIPEQAEYNVLSYFFSGTAVGPAYGQPMGAAPMNYLQVYGPDIQYASEIPPVTATVDESGGKMYGVTAQDLLQTAATQLQSISE